MTEMKQLTKPGEPETVTGYCYDGECGCVPQGEAPKLDHLALSRVHQQIGQKHRELAALYVELATEEAGR